MEDAFEEITLQESIVSSHRPGHLLNSWDESCFDAQKFMAGGAGLTLTSVLKALILS